MKKYLLAFAIPLGAYLTAANIVVVTSPSIDKVVLVKASGEASNGDYVYTHLTDPLVGDVNIVKRVMCTEGQTIKLIDHSFYCDYEYLGDFKDTTKKGDPLTPTDQTGIVPSGKAWLSGTHKDSYDSRYFGLQDISQLKRLYPIF